MCEGEKEGAKKREPVIDNGVVGERQGGRQTLHMKGIRWKERGILAQSGYSKCQNQDAVLIKEKWSSQCVWSSEDKSMIPLWQKKNTEQIFFSLRLFLPLISEWPWLDWIEQSLCIDLVSPLRINVISALCLCGLRGRWWRARLAVRQVGE